MNLAQTVCCLSSPWTVTASKEVLAPHVVSLGGSSTYFTSRVITRRLALLKADNSIFKGQHEMWSSWICLIQWKAAGRMLIGGPWNYHHHIAAWNLMLCVVTAEPGEFLCIQSDCEARQLFVIRLACPDIDHCLDHWPIANGMCGGTLPDREFQSRLWIHCHVIMLKYMPA